MGRSFNYKRIRKMTMKFLLTIQAANAGGSSDGGDPCADIVYTLPEDTAIDAKYKEWSDVCADAKEDDLCIASLPSAESYKCFLLDSSSLVDGSELATCDLYTLNDLLYSDAKVKDFVYTQAMADELCAKAKPANGAVGDCKGPASLTATYIDVSSQLTDKAQCISD